MHCWLLIGIIVAALGQPRLASAARASEIASYQITAILHPDSKTVEGTERITYHNPSPDTLNEVYLRLYLNAFRDSNTTWMRESHGSTRGFRWDPDHKGAIDLRSLSLSSGESLLATSTVSETLLHVPLPHPLLPGGSLELDVGWTATLPRVFARTGYGGPQNDFFMVGQWYPKMTVYDNGHWDTEPWHANAEFFNDPGSYTVDVTVPQGYVVGAVGDPQGAPRVADGLQTYHFRATDVTDVSFAASPHFSTVQGQAANADVVVYYLPEHRDLAQGYLHTASGALQSFSRWYGQYPHDRLVVIDVPDDSAGAGGMEYPMLVTTGTLGQPSALASLITAHEVGHQWWPMQTLTNEAREPWLDEGLTEYSGLRYNLESGDEAAIFGRHIDYFMLERLQYLSDPRQRSTLPSWNYSEAAYGVAVYNKMALSLLTLERVVGTDRLRAAFAHYLEQYRWKHPSGVDFRRSLDESLGDIGWFWTLLDTPGVIDYAVRQVSSVRRGTDYHSEATLVRTAEVAAPVEVLLRFGDGSTKREQWPGTEGSITYRYDMAAPLLEVLADPDRKLPIELHRDDDGVRLTPDVATSAALGSRILFWLQTLAQMLGTIG